MPNQHRAVYLEQNFSDAYFVYENATNVFIPLAEIAPAQSIENKIDSFATLPAGWDYGRGGPIARSIRDKAKNWYLVLAAQGFAYVNAFPGIDAITLAAGKDDHRIEMIISQRNAALSFGFAHDLKKKQQYYKTKLTEAEMQAAFAAALGKILVSGDSWNAFGWSTLGNTTRTAKASFEKHSKTWATRFPSSDLSAQEPELFAITSGGFTPSGNEPQVTHQYFGVSTPTVYRLRVA